jgi:hypothetical protein
LRFDRQSSFPAQGASAMIRFTCPVCSAKLKVKESSLKKSLTCPKCHEQLFFSGNASVPVVTRNLELPPKRLGSEPSWVDAEFEELPTSRKQPPTPTTAGSRELEGSVPSNEFESDYLQDEYQWEQDRQQRNKTITLSLALLGVGLVAVLGILIIVAKSKDQQKELASKEIHRKSDAREIAREPAKGAIQQRQPEQLLPEINSETEPGPESLPSPALDLPDDLITKSRPVISAVEIDRDHGLVLQFVKVKILPKGIKDPQWKGPWQAQKDTKEGKLYRIRGVASVLGDDFRQRESLVAYYLFIFDDAVTRWQKDPGDLSKVTICQVLDPEPLDSSVPSNPSIANGPGKLGERDQSPARQSKNSKIPGYKIQTIEGFRTIISDVVLTHDDDKAFIRKPLDTLKAELLEIVSILPARCVRTLRKVPIWVEWHDDNDPDLSRGVIAKYYGVSGNYRVWSLAHSKNPLKANCVEIIDLKTITAMRQRSGQSSQAVILHELAHAVHIQLFGSNNVAIRQAYQQAVDRKLYEDSAGPNGSSRKQYARANDHEYFAELSCAYFDRLGYFPKTRDELKEYDPVGFRIMELTWGKARQDTP